MARLSGCRCINFYFSLTKLRIFTFLLFPFWCKEREFSRGDTFWTKIFEWLVMWCDALFPVLWVRKSHTFKTDFPRKEVLFSFCSCVMLKSNNFFLFVFFFYFHPKGEKILTGWRIFLGCCFFLFFAFNICVCGFFGKEYPRGKSEKELKVWRRKQLFSEATSSNFLSFFFFFIGDSSRERRFNPLYAWFISLISLSLPCFRR